MKKINIFNAKLNAAGVFVVTALASGSALAEGEASTAMAAISTEAGSLIADAWPIVTTIVVASIAIKLFKKFANKAS
ncbi:hypothetical protein GCM10009098_07300 [Rheinheimera aquimaris]|uniref:Phage coat protein n=1 Tax=Rheinheimera aquimaris TaxID=412437 RepID=A0ABN1DFB4_9GAMM|nr:major coat protein [Rheinheimera aquimaris]MCB5212096.1 hypothetical protein [Rheinheimera aquimaris]